jgi:hypothetical protein
MPGYSPRCVPSAVTRTATPVVFGEDFVAVSKGPDLCIHFTVITQQVGRSEHLTENCARTEKP